MADLHATIKKGDDTKDEGPLYNFGLRDMDAVDLDALFESLGAEPGPVAGGGQVIGAPVGTELGDTGPVEFSVLFDTPSIMPVVDLGIIADES